MGKPLSIRLTDAERRRLDYDARQAGVKPSTYVRKLIAGAAAEAAVADATGPTPYDRIEDHEGRLARLEEMAGI